MIGDTVVEDTNHHELTKLAHGVTCSQTNVCKYLKKHLDITVNSQGREQTNSLIEKCANSLRQKNYFNFMRYMKMFFAIRNLISMKLINI